MCCRWAKTIIITINYRSIDCSRVWSDSMPLHFPLQPKTDDVICFHGSYVGSQTLLKYTSSFGPYMYTSIHNYFNNTKKDGLFSPEKNEIFDVSLPQNQTALPKTVPRSVNHFPQSINTELQKTAHPQICNSSLRTEMTMGFFLAAAALIKLHHFNVNFDEGWSGEMKGLLFGADWERSSDVGLLCLCVSQLWGSFFAYKVWPTLHVQIKYSGWGRLDNCNALRITDVSLACWHSANKITKCVRVRKPACMCTAVCLCIHRWWSFQSYR